MAARDPRGVLVFVAWLAAGCAAPLHYTLVAPQVSETNRYIGREVEIELRFGADRFGIAIDNTAESEIALDWSQCSFVTADGRAVRLVPVGEAPAARLPPGARMAAAFTLAQWHRPPSRLWHRRESLDRRLVYPPQIRTGVAAAVTLHLAMVFWDITEAGTVTRRDETLSLQFAVQDPAQVARDRRTP